MGFADLHPEERPVREVRVDRFAIQRGPVTVAQLARFTEDTGYLTLTERPPDPVDHPMPTPLSLEPQTYEVAGHDQRRPRGNWVTGPSDG